METHYELNKHIVSSSELAQEPFQSSHRNYKSDETSTDIKDFKYVSEWVSEWLSLTAFLEQRTARSI